MTDIKKTAEEMAEEYTDKLQVLETEEYTGKEVFRFADIEKAFLAGFQKSEEIKRVLTKEMILEVLNKYEQEMEGYSYYGSNPGVSRDDYSDIADELLQKIRMRDGT